MQFYGWLITLPFLVCAKNKNKNSANNSQTLLKKSYKDFYDFETTLLFFARVPFFRVILIMVVRLLFMP